MSTTTNIDVTGMTCGHCVSAVTSELSAIPGVTAVEVDLKPEGVTPVVITSESPLDPTAVAAAVDEAGYELEQA
ncbi:heavy-metal-associated domain-containing protein [Kineosporia succinea]|uniref:Copper chaperone CopZ n=1 Tax=Kineosporia succinea TaxID=84632 RepID=A0ABT9P1I6_9ACTN|nr:cation transporter [Kineosporia succinea]MDP9826426.1 copper chaperone CopZ [Kineosporia succinea]